MAEACEDHAASPSGEILMIMRAEVFQNNFSENLFFCYYGQDTELCSQYVKVFISVSTARNHKK